MKYCEECEAVGVKTLVEKYKNSDLRLCTFHYWLKKAKDNGYTIEEYVEKSKRFSFVTSLPERDVMKELLK